jgi:hypothetical protein
MNIWFDYDQTALWGSFANGPKLMFHTEAERIGHCRLLTYTASSCDPICAGGDVCIDGECESWPTRQDRGELQWLWPDSEQLVAPDALLGYDASGVLTQGGEASITFEEITLKLPTVDRPQENESWTDVILNRGSGDATLQWTNPAELARVRLYMTDCTGSHGGFGAAELECEAPDTGELVLPGSFLDALDAGDWTHGECGSHSLQRYHSATPIDDTSIRFETIAETGFFYRPDF